MCSAKADGEMSEKVVPTPRKFLTDEQADKMAQMLSDILLAGLAVIVPLLLPEKQPEQRRSVGDDSDCDDLV